MVIVNALANIIPINGITTGGVSNAYPNLFAPHAITFSIWGVIYALLAGYTIYQTGLFSKKKSTNAMKIIDRINPYFIASSIANILWIFSWHYRFIGVSVLFMGVILYCLIKIAEVMRNHALALKEQMFIKTPFQVYFGWITVATIANITTFLVRINWRGFGLTDNFWMIVVVIVAAAIGLIRMVYDRSIAYGLVFIWALTGIWFKHTSFFAGQYPQVISTVVLCIGIFIFAEISLYISMKNCKK